MDLWMDGERTGRRVPWSVAAIVALGVGAGPAAAGLLPPPPDVTWVGPDGNCDYATLQEALEGEVCDLFCAPPPGGKQFRISDAYQHSGEVSVTSSLAIIGGYASCGAPPTFGVRKQLFPVRIVIDNPGTQSIDVNLVNLDLAASASVQQIRGGVIEMTGHADLTLANTRVYAGVATQGGGIAMHGSGNDLILDSATVFDNEAMEEGGGIWCKDFGDIVFESGSIRDNEAVRRGGGIYLNDCDLTGDTPFADRFIKLNTILRSDPGKGAGIYLDGSSWVELGAANSRTVIDRNQILRNPDVSEFGDALGGGIHAEDGFVKLRDVHITGNIAPAGAAISSGVGSDIDIDRLSGTCAAPTTPSGATECSLIAGNVTTGRVNRDSDPDAFRSGEGVVFYGRAQSWKLRRTTVRDNRADCDGDCNEPSGSLFQVRASSNSPDTTFRVEQSLIVDNFLDDTCGFFCDLSVAGGDRHGLFSVNNYDSVDLVRNTVVRNVYKDSSDNDVKDFIFRTNGLWNAIGNIFHDNQIEDLVDTNTSYTGGQGTLVSAVCNVADYEAIDDDAVSATANAVADPLLVDPPSGNYRINSNSPAVNRCDDIVGGPTYDIAARLTPRDHGESQGGLNGYHDAGALENQLFAADEVDLKLNLTTSQNTTPPGVEYQLSVSNIGPTAAVDYEVRFTASGFSLLNDSWTCTDNAGVVTCTDNFNPTLGPSNVTTPMALKVHPDNVGNCFLSVFADPGIQPDVDEQNNDVERTVSECAGPDAIFDDGFEGS